MKLTAPETLTYIAIYLLIGWLMVEGAIASKEEDELLARVLSMYLPIFMTGRRVVEHG